MITLSNISFKWHKKALSNTLNIPYLSINKGEHVFLHGPSGCGKSTLLSLLAGINSPTSGELTILGKSLQMLTKAKRDAFRADNIGYIFQNFNLLPYLTPIENVVLGCQFSTSRKRNALKHASSLEQQAAHLLNALGLDTNLHYSNAADLSIGQQQRVAAARAFIGSPAIIIADEPTSALDTDNRQHFINLLFEQAKNSNSTLVFVSHDNSLQPLFNRSINLVTLQDKL
ncbi:ABC transporter ATP-binding protein [Pseudoalteromonas sp. MMG010]|uniref:ABC transporter ATP-binding protein n=1 Tax=Pseudoalteromonas sp. MMG010 TaxID=2822685 RepID=UPI001B3A7155|nr:ABC transporter ATP-binding protein [Pseudoalteromonas sp. MMG010]MBQ4832689.1 ABC transporter ATP-binding protein [Pseudoalteromonas sp. MMG010]